MIELQSVAKTFSKGTEIVEAVGGIDLTIGAREIVAVIGCSGCGKSTLLNMIAGLYPPSRGRAVYRGRNVTGVNTSVGYVTQKDNLLPWRTVRDNVLPAGACAIAFEQTIDLPRPRDVLNVRFEPTFKQLYDTIWDRLRGEYREERL